MTSISILKQVEDVQETIESSRQDITGGKLVDLNTITKKISALYETVADQPQSSMDVDVSKIATSLSTLMGELDGLEQDIDHQHQSIKSAGNVTPISAAAAYKG